MAMPTMEEEVKNTDWARKNDATTTTTPPPKGPIKSCIEKYVVVGSLVVDLGP